MLAGVSAALLLVVLCGQAIPETRTTLAGFRQERGASPIAASEVSLDLQPNGCARGVLLDGERLSGGPEPFCIREAVRVVLEDEALIAVRVDAPHRFEARVRSRVFLYRVRDGRLVPRFLGSGFSSREVTRLFVLEGALGLDTLTSSGSREALRCVFDGFPLVCMELPR
jgi:hypothetical protein